MPRPKRKSAEDSSELAAPGTSGNLLRVLKMSFLAMSLSAVVTIHVPLLPVPVQAMGHAFANAIGQEVRWTMFSADPRGTSIDLWAVLSTNPDESEVWTIDRHRPGGDLAHYHWERWMEHAVVVPERATLEGLANWLFDVVRPAAREITIYGETAGGVLPSEPPLDPEVAVLLRMQNPASP